MALNDVRATAHELLAVTADLDDTTARGASALPGWSRGHAITHIANFPEAMTRQVEEALQGRLVEVYDGGRPARDAAIEAPSQARCPSCSPGHDLSGKKSPLCANFFPESGVS